MRECRSIRAQFVEAYYGDLPGASRRRLEAHLDRCAACAAEFGEVSGTLDMLKAGKATPPSAEVLERSWEGIRNAILAEPSQAVREVKRSGWDFSGMLPRLAFSILLLVLGVWLGWQWRSRALPKRLLSGVQLRPLESVVPGRFWSHLQKSEVLLLEIQNFQAADDDNGELARELSSRVSEELLEEGELLRAEMLASEGGDEELLTLIRDLELILLQVAHLGNDPDTREVVDAVRSTIREQAILLRINLAIILNKTIQQQPGQSSFDANRNRS